MKLTTFSKKMPRSLSEVTYRKGGSSISPYECKLCVDCQKQLPLEAFHRRNSARDGRVNICRECVHQRYVFRTTGRGLDKRRTARAGVDEKWCPSCKRALPKHCFGSNASKGDGLTAYCSSCHNRISRANLIQIAGSSPNSHMKRRYGLT